jgi:beta-N-acetylhexosaminidase
MITPGASLSDPDRTRPIPAIFGLSRPTLTPLERQFFKASNPFGFILFKLIRELRQAVGRDDVPIFIDQEGGRVSRLQPPHWTQHPPARVFGAMYEKDPDWGAEAMQLYARIVAHELYQLNILVNCAPVLDLFVEGASSAIGDRALSRTPSVVAALARVWAETFLAHGVLPVIKHLPGHGRVTTDPHMMLPVIDATRAELESDDFVPFDLLKDLPIGMNSHAVFRAYDDATPASLSPAMHEVIRTTLGFDGLLLSDDLTMKALNGKPGALAQAALGAGTDIVLHCSGDLDEMQDIAAVLTPIGDESWARWDYAKAMVRQPEAGYDPRSDMARLDVLLGGLAYDGESVA